jgi:hypothetical protein
MGFHGVNSLLFYLGSVSFVCVNQYFVVIPATLCRKAFWARFLLHWAAFSTAGRYEMAGVRSFARFNVYKTRLKKWNAEWV